MKTILFLVIVSFFSCFANDSFIMSCQSKWNANAKAVKSIRSEMEQSVSVDEFKSTQTASFLFLNTDRIYNRINIKSRMGEIINVCRGDSLYLKVAGSKWQVQKEGCNSNSPFLMNLQMGKKSLIFMRTIDKIKIYKDVEGAQYKIETNTCRISEMSNDKFVATFVYDNIENVDIPVRIETKIIENSLRYDVEYKKIKLNKGVTKSFFNIE